MLNPILNEISTNESPTQSPKKIQNQIKIQPPYINLYLQKLKIEKKNFYLDDISCDKKERDENHYIRHQPLPPMLLPYEGQPHRNPLKDQTAQSATIFLLSW